MCNSREKHSYSNDNDRDHEDRIHREDIGAAVSLRGPEMGSSGQVLCFDLKDLYRKQAHSAQMKGWGGGGASPSRGSHNSDPHFPKQEI